MFIMINLTTKEKFLLEDEKQQEQLCVDKYNSFANKAEDPELKNLFSQLAQKEQEHLDSINQLLSGVVPSTNQQQGQQQSQQMQNSQQNFMNLNSSSMNSGLQNNSYSEHDKTLCIDALSTEKYVSSTYNTAIFEFVDKDVRQLLNHIQKEEQEHGEKIFNYMSQKGMYNVQ
ncbi:spore coat protein [Asaccharospora irregularis]